LAFQTAVNGFSGGGGRAASPCPKRGFDANDKGLGESVFAPSLLLPKVNQRGLKKLQFDDRNRKDSST
jgi:hypothetical protein